ncbi:hypothetical protein JMA_09870 [Jeotgalibacillus malaysiensis]|uniref:HTH lacI-type domain-containing protein n=1 Tax=Jeotgalibacillus malaysiensis TaxID=1508404 RepID=A0A0B5AQE4_9BACL|nr:LacI family DNA-binding transcriptional regulator [Jeotgalibacillus malaysiensis]AJD90304.1 hypothetical protein JMA_09870 [Jeotgalibacillus malaysiensis]
MANIRDVANKSKVSIATVSRILNGDKNLVVLEETRERVLAAIEELEYKPVGGRGRKKQHQVVLPKRKIGLLTWNSEEDDKADPYFKEIMYGIEDKAKELNMDIVITRRLREWRQEDQLEEVDGIIVIGKSSAADIAEIYQGKNIVFIDQSPEKHNFDSVRPDLEQATEEALEHLMLLGHRSIGFIGGREFKERTLSKKLEVHDARFVHFRRYMLERNLYRDEYTFLGNDDVGDWTTKAGYELMKKAISQKRIPTAFFIASDPMAIGAMRALHEAGYRVPEDVSLASVDDIDFALYVTPPLTTTRLFSRQIGMSAVQLLKERIEGREVPLNVTVSTELKIRQSTGKRES